MAYPYSYDPLDPYSSALAKPSEMLPKFTPEAESSLLGDLMEGSLGGLSYIGKVLDKTFGGRLAASWAASPKSSCPSSPCPTRSA